MSSLTRHGKIGLKPGKITRIFQFDFGRGMTVSIVESDSIWDKYGLKPDTITCLFELDIGSGTAVNAVESNSTWEDRA